MKIFRIGLVPALLAAVLVCSCEIEMSGNGRLDGMWHLVSVDTLSTSGVRDMSEERIYWSFQNRLLELDDKSGGKTFGSEREILYQVLWDMKRDIAELKDTIGGLLRNQDSKQPGTVSGEAAPAYPATVGGVVQPAPQSLPQVRLHDDRGGRHNDYIEEPEYLESTSLSLDDLEKEGIIKALEKHHGRRKAAAKELNISERTLYRKIKEYGIEM